MDQHHFRHVIGHFATGVTVVTTKDDHGMYAMTVNSLTSLSLAPPLVMIAVDLKAHTRVGLHNSQRFAVSILTENHSALSARFAQKDQPQDPFVGLPTILTAQGIPVLAEALAYLDCRIQAFYPGGDHEIVVAEVEYLQVLHADNPLIFYNSQYHRLGTS